MARPHKHTTIGHRRDDEGANARDEGANSRDEGANSRDEGVRVSNDELADAILADDDDDSANPQAHIHAIQILDDIDQFP